jgi:hypothetical protein
MLSRFVKNSRSLWDLYNKAKAYSTRPSVMLGIEDPYVAYCLDSAVFTFGQALKAELEGIEGKNKNEIKRKQDRVLQKWLDIPKQYRNPGVVGPGSKTGIEEQVVVKGEATT